MLSKLNEKLKSTNQANTAGINTDEESVVQRLKMTSGPGRRATFATNMDIAVGKLTSTQKDILFDGFGTMSFNPTEEQLGNRNKNFKNITNPRAQKSRIDQLTQLREVISSISKGLPAAALNWGVLADCPNFQRHCHAIYKVVASRKYSEIEGSKPYSAALFVGTNFEEAYQFAKTINESLVTSFLELISGGKVTIEDAVGEGGKFIFKNIPNDLVQLCKTIVHEFKLISPVNLIRCPDFRKSVGAQRVSMLEKIFGICDLYVSLVYEGQILQELTFNSNYMNKLMAGMGDIRRLYRSLARLVNPNAVMASEGKSVTLAKLTHLQFESVTDAQKRYSMGKVTTVGNPTARPQEKASGAATPTLSVSMVDK